MVKRTVLAVAVLFAATLVSVPSVQAATSASITSWNPPSGTVEHHDGVPGHEDVCPRANDRADQEKDGVPDACNPTSRGAISTNIPVLPVAAVGLALLAIVEVRRRW